MCITLFVNENGYFTKRVGSKKIYIHKYTVRLFIILFFYHKSIKKLNKTNNSGPKEFKKFLCFPKYEIYGSFFFRIFRFFAAII